MAPKVPPPSFSSFPDSKAKEIEPRASTSELTTTRVHDDDASLRRKRRAKYSDDEDGSDVREREKKKERREREKDRSKRSHSRDRDERYRKQRDVRRRTEEGEHDRHHRTSKHDGDRERSHRREKEVRHHDRRDENGRRIKDSESKGKERDSKARPSLRLGYQSASTVTIYDEQPGERRSFYVDVRGDDLNIRYGGLHRGDVPRFFRIGAGRIFGCDDSFRYTRASARVGKGLEVVQGNKHATTRYIDPRIARRIADKSFRRVRIGVKRRKAIAATTASVIDLTDPSSHEVHDGFISLLHDKTLAERLSKLEHEEGQDYRSVAGFIKPSEAQNLESDEGFGKGDASDSEEDPYADEEEGESPDQYIARQNKEFDRQLRDQPNDIKAWLDFVAFQDEVFGYNRESTTKRGLTKDERRATIEIKMSIIERALRQPGNEDSEELLIAHVQFAADFWEPKRVLAKWKDLLDKYPEKTNLWLEYVTFRQTNFGSFETKEIVTVFEESLATLANKARFQPFDSDSREGLEQNMIYLFLRCCLMMKQAGFNERALAAFQALIEVNYFRPDHLRSPRTYGDTERHWTGDVLLELQSFWDSESPRVGEENAKGWRNTEAEGDLGPSDQSLSSSRLDPTEPDQDSFQRWEAAERRAQSRTIRPGRTGVDDEFEEDPYRIVLFDDIRDLLFVLHRPDSRLHLVYAFLAFLGLPFVPIDISTNTSFATDAFIHAEFAENAGLARLFWPSAPSRTVPFDLVGGEPMEPVRLSGIHEPFEAPFRTMPLMLDHLFSSAKRWFCLVTADDLGPLDTAFIRNVYTQLRPCIREVFFTLTFFAFEAAQVPKNAVKVAKTVLKEERMNLVLWDGFARIERQRGKVPEARAVYVTALSMYRSFPAEAQLDATLLWRSWAEMDWEEGREDVCLAVLAAMVSPASEQSRIGALAKVDGDVPSLSASQILRTRQSFTSVLTDAFSPDAPPSMARHRSSVAFCSALFEYLTKGLGPACEVLELHLQRLHAAGASETAEEEELFLSYAKLLYRHSSTGTGFRPGQLRSLLERAIGSFPHNSAFVSLYFHNELRTKIQNRVRNLLEEKVLKEEDKVSSGDWLFAIFAELHLDATTYNPSAVRNLFDRAIENPGTRVSASAWSLYIDFEIKQGNLQRAKALVYRAINELPWNKDLYLKPFRAPLREAFRPTELRSLYSLMANEKGLRVHVDLDSVVPEGEGEIRDEDMGMDDGEGGMDDADARREMEERRRLLPY